MQNNNFAKDKKQLIIVLSSLIGLMLILFGISMCVGRYSISIQDVFGFFFGKNCKARA